MRGGNGKPGIARVGGKWRVCLTIVLFWVAGSRRAAGAGWSERWDSDPGYLNPIDLEISPGGSRLYVVCQESNEVRVVDTRTHEVIGRVKVGLKPEAIALSPDGKTLYVSNEHSDSVTEIDARSLRVRGVLKTGWGPVGLTTDRTGKFLYVANTLENDVSIINLATGHQVKRVETSRFPEYMDLSRSGNHIYVSNLIARLGPYYRPPVSEVTVINTRKQMVSERISVPGVIELRHIAQVPRSAGGYLLIPFMRPKNLNALIQIPQGWYLTHGMAVIWPRHSGGRPRARVTEVLLDDIDHYYADGTGAAVTPNGDWALITAASANVVSIINVARLNRLLQQIPVNDPEALADRLDSARHFVARRLPTGRDPTAVAVSPDNHYAYITNRLDDSISVVNLRSLRIVSTIDLGGPKEITVLRRGEQLFHDARFCYEGQFACVTCHPHGGLSNGLTWSFETPKLGHDLVQNRTLRSIAGTSPFNWNGMNPNLEVQDGPRTEMYIFRSQGFSPSEVRDLTSFVRSLRLPPDPYDDPGGDLTPAQRRGRAIFFRTKTNDGRLIPLHDRCYYCHAPLTHYTSRVQMNVGTATPHDTIQSFDVPQLQGVWMRAPYLHNGEALTLEEIWTKFNAHNQHGFTSDMNKAQLNDLVEFLKTL